MIALARRALAVVSVALLLSSSVTMAAEIELRSRQQPARATADTPPGAGAGTLPSLDVTGRPRPPVGCPGPDCNTVVVPVRPSTVPRGGYRRGIAPERLTTVGDWHFLDVPEGARYWRDAHFMPHGQRIDGGVRCRHAEPHFHGPAGVLILRVR